MRRMSEIFDAAYQGTRGANSEDAAIDLLTSMAKLLPRDTLEDVMRQGSRDSAAVASRRAAQVYGGVILADAIQDHAENYTRFLLISPSSAAAPRPSSSEYKTTIVFSVANAPGALYHSLRPFA